MKGFKFYLEYETSTEKHKATRKALGNHNGNVIAVMDGSGFFGSMGYCYECLGSVLYCRNSPVATTSVTPDYLSDRCKRISEAQAREIHPELFKRLDN